MDSRKSPSSSTKEAESKEGNSKSTSSYDTNAESDTVESKTDNSAKTATTKKKMSDDPGEVSTAKKHKTVHTTSDRNVEQTQTIPADRDCSKKLDTDDSISPRSVSTTSDSASTDTSSILGEGRVDQSSSLEDKKQTLLPLSDSSKISESDSKLTSRSPCDEKNQTKSSSSPTDKNTTKDSTSGKMDIHVNETASDSEIEVIILEPPPFTAASLFPDEDDVGSSPYSYLHEKTDEPSVASPVGDQEETSNPSFDERTERDDTNTDPLDSSTNKNSTKDSSSEEVEEVEEKMVCPYRLPLSLSPSMFPDSDDPGISPSSYLNPNGNESPVSFSASVGKSENNQEAARHSSSDNNVDESPTKVDLKRKRSTSSEEE